MEEGTIRKMAQIKRKKEKIYKKKNGTEARTEHFQRTAARGWAVVKERGGEPWRCIWRSRLGHFVKTCKKC